MSVFLGRVELGHEFMVVVVVVGYAVAMVTDPQFFNGRRR
jgi:hypothetical protein